MDTSVLEGINIALLNIDRKKVNYTWDYEEVISPFTRLFYIRSGKAQILHQNQQIELKPGNIYLIPSFTQCTYKCNNNMELIYIHAIIELTNGINFFEEFEVKHEIEGDKIIYNAFDELCRMHPNKKLPDTDPGKYQPLTWSQKAKTKDMSPTLFLMTQAYLLQIVSKFVIGFQKSSMYNHSRYVAIKASLRKINNTENSSVSVNTLAKEACLSPDYYSRIFKQVCGISPQEYIAAKKLEKAIVLLNTTSKSIESISEVLGFENTQNFTRFFKKKTNMAPGRYRQTRKIYSI